MKQPVNSMLPLLMAVRFSAAVQAALSGIHKRMKSDLSTNNFLLLSPLG
ncbi:MAG: hypothetical protein ACRDE2_03300 [Chitinophagaceae bacterium]